MQVKTSRYLDHFIIIHVIMKYYFIAIPQAYRC